MQLLCSHQLPHGPVSATVQSQANHLSGFARGLLASIVWPQTHYHVYTMRTGSASSPLGSQNRRSTAVLVGWCLRTYLLSFSFVWAQRAPLHLRVFLRVCLRLSHRLCLYVLSCWFVLDVSAGLCADTAMLARFALSLSVDSTAHVFVTECDPFCALQACMGFPGGNS